jgi:hypothetical protein
LRRRHSRPIAAAALCVSLAGAALCVSLASAVSSARAEPQPSPAPDVPLERLLKLPDSALVSGSEPRRGGKTRAEWQARFQTAQAELETARKALEDARHQLEEIAPDRAWSMTAPGLPANAAPSDAPIDYRLRQEIRRQREEVERAERRLEELAVEANLAEVPEEWRRRDPPQKR